MAFAACARPPASPPPAALQEQSSIVELPLKRGFYVASDTACGAASNATLLLLRRDGIGGARDFCEFRSIERTGPASFRVAEACSDLQSAEAEVNEGQVVFANYTLEGDGAYIRVQDSGWVSQARYCEQESLPADWRDIDISDVVE